MHALKDKDLAGRLSGLIKAGKPVLITDGLAKELAASVNLKPPNVRILPVNEEPESLLRLSQNELDALRAPLLRPFKVSFRAPNRVSLCLFTDGSWVAQNFNDQPAQVEVNGQSMTLAARGWKGKWVAGNIEHH